MTTLLTSSWREWYFYQHQSKSLALGTAFETYATSVLEKFHNDFVNPDPAGRLGDGGCDGLAESGTIAYACFGSLTQRDAERKLEEKVLSDFERAFSKWPSFKTWRFITNSTVGPLASQILIELQKDYGPESDREVQVRLWRPQHLWEEAIVTLSPQKLDLLYPGCPGAANIELADLIELLDLLRNVTESTEQAFPVNPVPIDKMDFNQIPQRYRIELGQWRDRADQIRQWFVGSGDPDLEDHEGARFRDIYETARNVDPDPAAILERIYIALGGTNFRLDTKLANAVYAVTSYFFDLCHIFEAPVEVDA